jgi:hypothetical protein
MPMERMSRVVRPLLIASFATISCVGHVAGAGVCLTLITNDDSVCDLNPPERPANACAGAFVILDEPVSNVGCASRGQNYTAIIAYVCEYE